MNGYKAFFQNKQLDIYAKDLYEAKMQAIAKFKASRGKSHLVHVHLCELDVDSKTEKGKQVNHIPDF